MYYNLYIYIYTYISLYTPIYPYPYTSLYSALYRVCKPKRGVLYPPRCPSLVKFGTTA